MKTQKLLLNLLAASILVCLFSCSPGKENDPGALGKIFSEKVSKMDIKNFQLPDSIDPSLVVAVYLETEPEGHTLLVYTDTNRKIVSKITWLADTIMTEPLEQLKYNEFRSMRNQTDYVVRERSVATIYIKTIRTGYTPQQSVEYVRTDTDRVKIRKGGSNGFTRLDKVKPPGN